MITTGGQKFTSLPKIKKIIDMNTTGGQKFTSLPKIKKDCCNDYNWWPKVY